MSGYAGGDWRASSRCADEQQQCLSLCNTVCAALVTSTTLLPAHHTEMPAAALDSVAKPCFLRPLHWLPGSRQPTAPAGPTTRKHKYFLIGCKKPETVQRPTADSQPCQNPAAVSWWPLAASVPRCQRVSPAARVHTRWAACRQPTAVPSGCTRRSGKRCRSHCRFRWDRGSAKGGGCAGYSCCPAPAAHSAATGETYLGYEEAAHSAGISLYKGPPRQLDAHQPGGGKGQ